MAEGHRRLFGVLVVLVAVVGATTLGGADDGGGAYIASTAPTAVQVSQEAGTPELSIPTTSEAVAEASTTTTAATPVSTTRAVVATAVTTTTSPAVPPTTLSTLAPPTTTTTTTVVCRNSANPACGPFRFDPQPGPDRPMSVHVLFEPAAPTVGQEVVFTIHLNDPDGVSINGSTYNYGDSGIGESSVDPCTKYGPWDPPAPDPANATQVVTLRHTYAQAGTYKATFFFTGFPFDCEDSVTGRGDRPYASSASGTVTFEVK